MYDDLPMLPGAIGPATPTFEFPAQPAIAPTIVVQHQPTASALTETVTFPRIVFPSVDSEPQVGALTSIQLVVPTDPFAGWTKAQLYERAREMKLPGRSRMTKATLHQALLERYSQA